MAGKSVPTGPAAAQAPHEEAAEKRRPGRRPLIVLAPGRDTRRPRENLMEQYDQFR